MYKNKTDHVCISVHGEKNDFLILYIFVLIECLSKNISEFEFENVLFISIFSLFYPITLEGRRGTTDEFATIPFHLDLFSAALVELAKSIPVHSLILSSHNLFIYMYLINSNIFVVYTTEHYWENIYLLGKYLFIGKIFICPFRFKFKNL